MKYFQRLLMFVDIRLLLRPIYAGKLKEDLTIHYAYETEDTVKFMIQT